MDGKIEQRVYIKFCVKLGKSATETLEMLRESFREHSLSRTGSYTVYIHNLFMAEREEFSI
jgi:CRISPR/Cas system-associated protein Cas10 (large subunit of type III CRISPR-Cas system)